MFLRGRGCFLSPFRTSRGKMKKIITFVFALLVFSGIYAVADGLVVYPSRIDIQIDKNDAAESAFSVTNTYNVAVEVEIGAYAWNTYKGNGNLDINSWLKVSESHIRLEAGETKKIAFTVQTSDAMVGSIGGQVGFAASPPGSEGIVIRVSCPVYLTIRGTEKVNFAVSKVAVHGGEGSDIQAEIYFRNRGNVHVRPSGSMKVYDGKKKLVYTADISENYPSYAGEETSLPAVAKIPASLDLAPGLYTGKIVMNASGKTVKKKIKFRIRSDNSVIF